METIYLETSVPSAYFDIKKEDPKRKAITRKFWAEILPNFKTYTSVLVIRELDQVEESLVPKFLELVSGIEQLPITKEVEELAGKYVIGGIIPKTKIADAIHLAVTTVNGIDYLVSWNVRHLTRPTKRKQIAEFNSKLGIYVPVISTPDDFLETL